MKVILLLDTAKLGKRGAVVEVADGYAINVLLKQGKAVQATPQELLKWKQMSDKKEREKDTALKAFHDLSVLLTKNVPTVTVAKHDNGHLFASVSTAQLVDAIFESTKVSVSPSQITLPHIKTLGEHSFELKAGEKIAKFTFSVVAKK